jgi:predicted DsbA family dithiol-disulfide isomerase
VLIDGCYADEVRADEAHWRSEGVTSVPTILVDGKYLISGAQSPDRYARAIRKIACACYKVN